MFTICFAVYASLVSVTPVDSECIQVGRRDLNEAINACALTNRDPLTTCEARASGALNWYITIRRIEGT